jgi:predicted nucleic acid-binding protein
MLPRVYIETSVISYLTARPSSDPILFGQQELTKSWWSEGAKLLELCCSDVVWEEASRGDKNAAALRLVQLEGLLDLPVTQQAVDLAEKLLQAGALPQQAFDDALHVAVCATNGVDILVSWNCKHIANVTMYGVIDNVCRSAGYEPPRICTPVELWGM